MIKFLFVLFSFSFISFSLNAESSEDTEAGFQYDTRKGLDFCCDRATKSESAHDLSDQESRRIVEQTLYAGSKSSSKPKPPAGGQR